MGSKRMGPPADLVLWLAREFGLQTFVETGTYRGETAWWAAQNFKRVISIEGSRELYEDARSRYAAVSIEFLLGDSRDVFQRMLPSLQEPAVFWLDAHWCGAQTHGKDNECPLLGEIAAINRSEREHFVLVDDARLFLAPPPRPHRAEQWPAIADVIDALRAGRKRHVIVLDDAIIAGPEAAAPKMTRYCQDITTTAWEQTSPPPSRICKTLRLLRDLARIWT